MSEADATTNEARDERRLRVAVGAFSALLLVTIVASIHLSTLGLTFGSLVYGSVHVWRGHDAAFRIAAIDGQGTTLIGGMSARVALRDGKGVRDTAEASGEEFLDARLSVPQDLGGDATLEVEVETEAGDDHFTLKLVPVDRPPPMRGRITSHREALTPDARPPAGGYEVRLYPEAGSVVAGLPNPMQGWVLDGGKPTAVPLHVDDPGLDAASDALGLFAFVYTPPPVRKPLRFAVGEAPTLHVDVPLDPKPMQLVIDTKPRRFAQPGGAVEVTVRTLPFRGPLFIDVWAGGCVLLATSARPKEGKQELELVLPAAVEGFVRIDAYRDPFAASDNAGSALLWASAKPAASAAEEALAAVATMPGADPVLTAAQQATGEGRARYAHLALSRVQPAETGLMLLRNTVQERRAVVERERDGLRVHVHRLFALTFALGVGMAIAWGIRHTLGVKRAVRGVVDEDPLDEAETPDDAKVARAARYATLRHLYNLALALAAIGMAAYSIYVLLTRMRWG